MNVNLHAIGNSNFSVKIVDRGAGNADLELTVGGAVVNIFLHDGKTEKALADIEHAIRVFQMEQATTGVIEGGNL